MTVGETLQLTLVATDADLPVNAITFSFAEAPPAGVTLNANTGVLAWTPTASQVGNYTLVILATDNGLPALSDSVEIQGSKYWPPIEHRPTSVFPITS